MRNRGFELDILTEWKIYHAHMRNRGFELDISVETTIWKENLTTIWKILWNRSLLTRFFWSILHMNPLFRVSIYPDKTSKGIIYLNIFTFIWHLKPIQYGARIKHRPEKFTWTITHAIWFAYLQRLMEIRSSNWPIMQPNSEDWPRSMAS